MTITEITRNILYYRKLPKYSFYRKLPEIFYIIENYQKSSILSKITRNIRNNRKSLEMCTSDISENFQKCPMLLKITTNAQYHRKLPEMSDSIENHISLKLGL